MLQLVLQFLTPLGISNVYLSFLHRIVCVKSLHFSIFSQRSTSCFILTKKTKCAFLSCPRLKKCLAKWHASLGIHSSFPSNKMDTPFPSISKESPTQGKDLAPVSSAHPAANMSFFIGHTFLLFFGQNAQTSTAISLPVKRPQPPPK